MSTFTGVVRNGRLHADSKAELENHLAALEGVRVTFTIEDKRTTEANGYLWGVVYEAIAEYMGDYSKEAIHEFMKRRFLKRSTYRVVNIQTGEFVEEEIVESSSIQSVKGFWAFTEEVKLFAAEFMGLEIPEAVPVSRPRRKKPTV
jgi:hypothetical protein